MNSLFRALMFQGTGSDVGKSLVVAGLCRFFARQGLRVVPFKAQNMSNNAAVTSEGGEIGRAQWLQALAARVEPSVHMNPVLLKPETDRRCQVVVRGKVIATMGAQDYQNYRQTLLPTVIESYHHLAKGADLVLIEGAGSPAEINLRSHDVANMGFARAVHAPVILVGDIDRGGVIASLVGTHAVLAEEDRNMIAGFIINKFRGDAQLFTDGMAEIARRTGWKSLGLVPYHPPLAQLPQEDSLALSQRVGTAHDGVHIAVLAYPHIANFDDIDPLKNEPGVRLSWLKAGDVIPADASLVILPGSKSTIADLSFIKAQGWDIDLCAHYRRGGRILGICGGFQMLGKILSDPDSIEGPPASVEGLGLLDISTVFTPKKTVTPWRGRRVDNDADMSGYEIHLGVSEGAAMARPLFYNASGNEGACSEDGLVWGTYVHGLFANDHFRADLLKRIGAASSHYIYREYIERILDGWADVLEQSLPVKELLSMAEPLSALPA